MKRHALFVNPILYHYRRGVFRALDRHSEIDATFVSGTVGRGGIAVFDPSDLTDHVAIRVYRLGPIEWHSGLIGHVVRNRYTDFVFLGNPAVITYWLAAVVGRFRGGRVYFWTIGWHRPEKGIKRVARLAFYRLAHALLIYGEVGKQIGTEMGYPSSRIHVIGNSIDIPEGSNYSPQLDLPNTRGDVLWIGAVIRLSPQKNLGLVLEAAAVLRDRGIDARVLIVGQGPERERLLVDALRLGVPLLLPGAAYGRADLEAVYDLLDITVVPSAVGLTAIQSLAFGVPVVSDDDLYTQMPEWEALVPGLTGAVYRVGDPNDLAARIRDVAARLSHSDGAIARACRAEYEARWSPEVHAERIVKAMLTHGA